MYAELGSKVFTRMPSCMCHLYVICIVGFIRYVHVCLVVCVTCRLVVSKRYVHVFQVVCITCIVYAELCVVSTIVNHAFRRVNVMGSAWTRLHVTPSPMCYLIIRCCPWFHHHYRPSSPPINPSSVLCPWYLHHDPFIITSTISFADCVQYIFNLFGPSSIIMSFIYLPGSSPDFHFSFTARTKIASSSSKRCTLTLGGLKCSCARACPFSKIALKLFEDIRW